MNGGLPYEPGQVPKSQIHDNPEADKCLRQGGIWGLAGALAGAAGGPVGFALGTVAGAGAGCVSSIVN
ncbi:MAG TPA: hypothetical protein VHT91_11815 [Kofleriaceae bacterium]|nr:hypothetical protein [Kofleriaceae bacterium]